MSESHQKNESEFFAHSKFTKKVGLLILVIVSIQLACRDSIKLQEYYLKSVVFIIFLSTLNII
jgi:hypothetical protein